MKGVTEIWQSAVASAPKYKWDSVGEFPYLFHIYSKTCFEQPPSSHESGLKKHILSREVTKRQLSLKNHLVAAATHMVVFNPLHVGNRVLSRWFL